jgi:ABC-type transport system involved in multi-copper enzyme maturation permease subunit
MTAGLRRAVLVALVVLREALRERVWYATGVFAVAMLATVVLIAEITAGQDVKVVKDVGLALIELVAVGTAIVIGVGLISREVERRSIFVLLAKPVSRWEVVVGKFAGLVLTIAINLVGMTVVLYLVLALVAMQLDPGVELALEAPVIDPRLVLVTLSIGGEAALAGAVALLFSSFSSSTLLSVGLTTGIYVVGLLGGELRSMGEIPEVSPAVAQAVQTVGWIVPAFSAFDIKPQVVHGLDVPAGFILSTAVYGLLYTAALLAAAVVIFERREFT